MNPIDWLRSACDPAVVLDIGYRASPYQFFIGLSVWRAGQLPPRMLPLLPRPPSSSVSQGWWCHSAGPCYWIRAISLTVWFSESNPISFAGAVGLRVGTCFLFCDGITGLPADAINWNHPMNRIPRDTKTMWHTAVALPSILREKRGFQQLKESWQTRKLLRNTVSGTFKKNLSSRFS